MSQNWICPKCKAYNHPRRQTCWQCNRSAEGIPGAVPRTDWRLILKDYRSELSTIGCFGVSCLVLALIAARLFLRTQSLPAQVKNQPTTYELNWKIEAGHPVIYDTTFKNSVRNASIDSNLFSNNQSPDGQSPDDQSPNSEQWSQLLEMVNGLESAQTYFLDTTLDKTAQGNISVKMNVREIKQEPAIVEQQDELLSKMAQGRILLQGEITPEGKITSDYIAQEQKNLLALFFELPGKPVKVSDAWPIDLVCIVFDSSQFTVKTASQENQVTFTKTATEPSGETVAVLDYKFAEVVEGAQVIPFFSEEPLPASMKCTGIGQGEFLVEQGRWKQFSFEYTIEMTGFMTGTVIQDFALSSP